MLHKNFLKAFPLFLLLSLQINAGAQDLTKLQKVKGVSIEAYHSIGKSERAEAVARRTEKAILYFEKLLDFRPDILLLALSPEDWSRYTDFPVYGMAHFKDDNKTLVVATDDNEFFRSFLPPLESLPPALAGQVRSAYTVSGDITMMPFFDLLSLHELGHAFHLQGGLNVQRKWMGELFCNILLHTYIAENEPEQLAALTVFPNMVVAAGTEGYQFTSLQQLEDNYELIGKEHPKNYGWYQSRWHAAARQIYDEKGKDALLKLWNALKQQGNMTDEEMTRHFKNTGNTPVADLMIKW